MTKEEILQLSISIVVYKSYPKLLLKLFDSLSGSELKMKIFVIDNSPDDRMKCSCQGKDIVYIFNGKNVGYGSGHNIAIKKIVNLSKYHLIVNPDVWFQKGTLEKLYQFMEDNTGIGLAMPRVLYPDGAPQYLCRLLPSPLDLLIRRFKIPFLTDKWDKKHALKFTGYDNIMEVPYLSGCFMFVRNKIFENVGLFDERFFMYLEDVDLSRRIHKCYRTVYYPEAVIYHGFQKSSYKDLRILKYHMVSASRYFNKWGWFIDRERKRINRKTISRYARI